MSSLVFVLLAVKIVEWLYLGVKFYFKESKYFNFENSVADPGCLSRIRIFSIPDPGSEFFPSRIPDLHQRIEVF
jgi:hypothetical protein